MRLLTPDEMRRADRYAIDELGIPGLDLMERAGTEVARAIEARFGASGLRVVVLCGKGNNGGDGFVAARRLASRGARVDAVLFATAAELTGDAAANRERAAAAPGVSLREAPDSSGDAGVAERIASADVVVDALLGTGFAGAPRGRLADAIALSRAARGAIAAIDAPSGVNCLSGAVDGEAVRADLTVTLAAPKVGLYLHPGRAFAGEIVVVPIGMPEEALERAGGKAFLFDEEDARALVKPRRRDAHKGDFGRILVVGGSPNYTGAPVLAGLAALRAGGGLVTLGVPASLQPLYAARVLELMTFPLPDRDGVHSGEGASLLLDRKDRFDVLAAGPGFARGGEQEEFLRRLLARWEGPLVVDADGLHALARKEDRIASTKASLVLTPHLGELEALTGRARAEILADRVGFVRETSATLCAVLLLKGNPTLVADPSGAVTLNTTGNPGMATAGSGDVLTGCIAALLGRGLVPAEAARLGVWLHGKAGDLAADANGEAGLIAGDIILHLPAAILPLERESSSS
ncbi:MAG: NAD(P)H-hydrate dehydratase [Candidatus Latescibacterota bacterium]|nr:MAG: NAD(P)H-hydrate dehydratase [Candidatus Latescibacterota bacterium]